MFVQKFRDLIKTCVARWMWVCCRATPANILRYWSKERYSVHKWHMKVLCGSLMNTNSVGIVVSERFRDASWSVSLVGYAGATKYSYGYLAGLGSSSHNTVGGFRIFEFVELQTWRLWAPHSENSFIWFYIGNTQKPPSTAKILSLRAICACAKSRSRGCQGVRHCAVLSGFHTRPEADLP